MASAGGASASNPVPRVPSTTAPFMELVLMRQMVVSSTVIAHGSYPMLVVLYTPGPTSGAGIHPLTGSPASMMLSHSPLGPLSPWNVIGCPSVPLLLVSTRSPY